MPSRAWCRLHTRCAGGRIDLLKCPAQYAGTSNGYPLSPEKQLMSTPQRISLTESGSVTVVTFNDSKILDEQEIQDLGQELNDLVESDDRKKIILNFSSVEFLSSAALGKLISFEKKTRQNKAKLMLSNIRPEIYEVFAITKLTKLFKIKDTEADARAAL